MKDAMPPNMDTEAKALDIDFITSGYRLVSDDAAFADCVVAWTRQLEKVEAEGEKPVIDEDSLVSNYVNGIKGLLDKLSNPRDLNPIDEAVSEVNAAAMVITANTSVVVAANMDASERFNAVQGKENDLSWLDPVSLADFQAVCTNAQALMTRKHAIVRTYNGSDSNGIAEVYTLPAQDSDSVFIVVRALETRWAATVDTTLKQVFGLTLAEREVTRALYETRDTAHIALSRKTTPLTIRTQVRTILRKTGTASQVDLVRLIGLLNARVSFGQRSKPAAWQDPWGNYGILIRPNGQRVAHSWTGARNGVPALIVHGNVQGYLLGDLIEKRLKKEGIRLYSIIRPGFADSDICPDTNSLEQQAETIGWAIERLGLQNVPAIGLGHGAVLLYYLAARRPELISHLLVTGLLQPYSCESMSRFTPAQKVMIKLSRYAPKTSEVLARVCYRYVLQKGADWYLTHGWNDVPEVRRVFANPDILPLIRSACELTLTTDVKGFIRETQVQWDFDSEIIQKITCPISHLHGEHDRSVTACEARELSQRMENFSSEEVPGAGYFLPYEKPELFADRIINTVLRLL